MVRWNGRGCGSWDGDTGVSGVAVGVGILQGQWQREQVWRETRGNVARVGDAGGRCQNAEKAGKAENAGKRGKLGQGGKTRQM